MRKLSPQELQLISGGNKHEAEAHKVDKTSAFIGYSTAAFINIFRHREEQTGYFAGGVDVVYLCQKILDPIKELAASYGVPALDDSSVVAYFACGFAVELINPYERDLP